MVRLKRRGNTSIWAIATWSFWLWLLVANVVLGALFRGLKGCSNQQLLHHI